MVFYIHGSLSYGSIIAFIFMETFLVKGGVLISKMKLGFHGLWNTLSPWRYNTSLALYVKHFNIQYSWALAQNSNFHLLWLMYCYYGVIWNLGRTYTVKLTYDWHTVTSYRWHGSLLKGDIGFLYIINNKKTVSWLYGLQ